NNNDNTHVYDIGLSLAPKLSFAGKVTVSPSVQINYFGLNSEISTLELNVDNNLTPVLNNYQNHSLRLVSGLLINTKKFQMGISTTILESIPSLNRNNHIFNTYVKLGYKFSRSEEAKFVFTPVILLNFPSQNYLTPT